MISQKEVIIDQNAGFCFGVVSAIHIAEEELQQYGKVYCLGDIVHNEKEVARLASLGLQVISHDAFDKLSGQRVFIRAHGEPPITYEKAKQQNISLIDATCPIVLKLQQKINSGYLEMKEKSGQVVIFGGKNHPEVVGLRGQTNDTAIVVGSKEDLSLIDYSKPVRLYSQTTKNKEEYSEIIAEIEHRLAEENTDFIAFNTTCGRVANRTKQLHEFTKEVDIIIFVSGKKSSNGMYLYNHCKQIFDKTYWVSEKTDIQPEWFENASKTGITGATSTPMWLMEDIKAYIENNF